MPQAASKAPRLTSVTKEFHESGAKPIEGPSGAFESRTAIACRRGT